MPCEVFGVIQQKRPITDLGHYTLQTQLLMCSWTLLKMNSPNQRTKIHNCLKMNLCMRAPVRPKSKIL